MLSLARSFLSTYMLRIREGGMLRAWEAHEVPSTTWLLWSFGTCMLGLVTDARVCVVSRRRLMPKSSTATAAGNHPPPLHSPPTLTHAPPASLPTSSNVWSASPLLKDPQSNGAAINLGMSPRPRSPTVGGNRLNKSQPLNVRTY